MLARLIHKIIFVFCLWPPFVSAQPQTFACPVNLDFESGNFTNWECRTGQVFDQAGTNTIQWNSSGAPSSNRHEIIAASTQLDQYGFFPQQCPNGSRYSVKLGNSTGGHEAEGISYTYQIPANDSTFSLLYYYAVVLQAPSHTASQQPRFRARITDVADGSEISCVSFDFTASGSLPGFKVSPVSGLVLYKDWTPISVDLSKYAGRTVQIEFITSDCTFQQHFGYAYIDVGSSCNGTIAGSTYCEGDSAIKVTAPYGFQSYQWFANSGFTQVISTAQTLVLDSGNVGSVFPVIITPYDGFGCLDTLYATIGRAPKPVSNAGPDKVLCNKVPTQLGTNGIQGYSYSWSPADFVSDPTAAAPYTVPVIISPLQLTVRTTDIASGCFSLDSALVTPIVVDTASAISGKQAYCPGEPIAAFLSVTNASTQVQWYQNSSPLSGSTGFTYQPLSFGTYWARLFQNGCIDTTRRYVIASAPVPKASFTVDKELQCLDKPIHFNSTSTINSNEPLTYVWKLSDGSSFGGQTILKSFPAIGQYAISLVVTSASNCMDSTMRTVAISSLCSPVVPTAFTPNRDGKNDVFKPYLVGIKMVKRFVVYNRYGNIVFSSTSPNAAWDGTYKGAALDTGVYVWLLEYIDDDDKAVLQKGTVALIR